MSDMTQLTTHELWVDGHKIQITAAKINPTTLRISWVLPSTYKAYDGAIVLLSEEKFSSVNFPVDGTRYTASSNWTAPADTIDHANVVASFYGFFGDDITQSYVDVSNIDPNKLYYASIHAASNVLQYFTIGVQSYPLESSRIEKNSPTYAGSIPTSVVPPANPTNGQVYFDPVSNLVVVWNDGAQAWLQANTKTVPTGNRPPVGKNQVFLNSINTELKAFVGGSWQVCDAGNTRIKVGAAWVPLGTVTQSAVFPEAPAAPAPVAGDVIFLTLKAAMSAPPTGEVRVYTMGQWFLLTSDLIQFETSPSVWENLSLADPLYGSFDPFTPEIGDFFYDTSTKDLLVWTGFEWLKADTDSEGSPTTDKVGVGTDGSYDDRLRLISILKGQLGWPQVCVELSEEQFNIAIDNALDEFRRRADNAYTHNHVAFTLKKNQSKYYLNDPRNDSHRIVNVLKIHRINMLGVSALSSEANIYAQTFFNQFFQGSMVDLTSLHLTHQLSETFEKIFAGNLVFSWDEASRQLTILRRIMQDEERVIIECVMERTEQELLLDRWAKQWLQGWAHAELKEMLGMIRSKYSSGLPGPNGGISLNGDLLLSEARADFEELLRQINDYEVGNGGTNFGNTAFFIG